MAEPNPNDLYRLHIQVMGYVQGVGFRSFVQQSAALAGLNGWVRNVGYDSVETIAEGPREKLERFASTVKNGPQAARVDEVKVEWETASGEFLNFRVRNSV